mmetsp:Transcript_9735/g.21023  ORF Transcript_9735/g.21023 Transcript_9735/m.21023 type:complete len:144 (+) Transcript_9735:214-645(+)
MKQPAAAPDRWATWLIPTTPPEAAVFASLRNWLTTNCPKTLTSMIFRQSRMSRHDSLDRIETEKRPNTAPEAPKLTVFGGSTAKETRLETTPQKIYEKTNPKGPSSSSTDLPNRSSKKVFPLKCDLSPWQNVEVMGCHHCQFR